MTPEPAIYFRTRGRMPGVSQRRRKRAGSSKGAQNRLQPRRGSPRKPGHDGAWYTLLARRLSELIKIVRTSPLKAGDAGPLDAVPDTQIRDRTPSNAWARKIPAPTRPITAVTISNIAVVLCAPAQAHQTTSVPAQSKRFRTAVAQCLAVGICCNRCVRIRQRWLQEWRKSND